MSALPKGKRGRPSKKEIEAREAAAAAAEAEEHERQLEAVLDAAQNVSQPVEAANYNAAPAPAAPAQAAESEASYKIELNQAIEWDNNFTGFRKIGAEEETEQLAAQKPVEKFGIEEDIFIDEEVQPQAAAVVAEPAPVETTADNQNVYSLSQAKKEVVHLPQKYFATSNWFEQSHRNEPS